MSFSEETKQIMKHYLELYLKGTIIREEQDVLDAYVEEIKNSTNPEDIAFVSTYQGKVNKTREETLAKEAGLRGTSWPDVRSAFQAARQSSTKKDLIFVGGSTFIVADFLAFYHPEQA